MVGGVVFLSTIFFFLANFPPLNSFFCFFSTALFPTHSRFQLSRFHSLDLFFFADFSYFKNLLDCNDLPGFNGLLASGVPFVNGSAFLNDPQASALSLVSMMQTSTVRARHVLKRSSFLRRFPFFYFLSSSDLFFPTACFEFKRIQWSSLLQRYKSQRCFPFNGLRSCKTCFTFQPPSNGLLHYLLQRISVLVRRSSVLSQLSAIYQAS